MINHSFLTPPNRGYFTTETHHQRTIPVSNKQTENIIFFFLLEFDLKQSPDKEYASLLSLMENSALQPKIITQMTKTT